MDANRADTPGLAAEDSADFSLVLGGPLYQLLRRSHLSDDTLTLVHRRIIAGILIAFLGATFLAACLLTYILGIMSAGIVLATWAIVTVSVVALARLLSCVF